MKHFYTIILISFACTLSSCSTFKQTTREMVIESISDPQTGTPVFTRNYDTEPYGVNLSGIKKARKQKKKKKQKEVLENYGKLTSNNVYTVSQAEIRNVTLKLHNGVI